ncbi:MAG TPA: signal peptidase I [Streptosporangiaceae bacterium]|nr:signal peptidase I [Streptosporangiaceae bacterium]
MSDPADPRPAGEERAGEEPAAQGPRRRGWRRVLAELITIALVAVLLAGLVRTFVVEPFWIPSASMVPTLGVYDRILVQKAFFSWHDVREGDIVVFSQPPRDHCPGPQGDLVKRVIALPGQTIYSSGNSIYIDGRRLAEPYLPRYDPLGPAIPDATSGHPYRVPPGEFYVLGDNRADSCDSRYWGPITGASIVGTVILTFWHDGRPEFRRF